MNPSLSDSTGRRYPTSETLMAEAMAAAKLSDFGSGDFRRGLDVLLASLECEVAACSSIMTTMTARRQRYGRSRS